MANTVIQLKWSDVTSAPTSLNVGEAAYSNTSQRLYIGDTSNNVLTIGGKFFVDQQGLIFTKTNVAFDTANSAASYANAAFAMANSGSAAASAASYANSAFGVANGAASYANSGFSHANSAFNTANSAASAASSAQGTADAALTAAGVAQSTADAASSYANSAFLSANNIAGVNLTQNTNISNVGTYANSAFLSANTPSHVANSAALYANSAFTRANNSLNANTGGQISGDLSITGNLTVTGNVISISTSQIVANDTLIVLGVGNYTSDILDIGFAGHYNDGANAHTGLIRDAATKEWQLFEGYTPEITANNNIDTNAASFRIATLNANVHSTKVLIKGIDLLPYVNNAYTAANTADAKGTSAGSYANSGFEVANSGASYANSAFIVANNSLGIDLTQNTNITNAGTYANSAFAAANTADAKAVTSGAYANSGFAVANSAASYANSAFIVANNSLGIDTTQNTNITNAGTYANAAFAQANTDFTNISTTAADYGTASSVPAFRVEANGRISSANSTAIAIAASAITSGTLGVARGGTGAATFTTNGVLLGQGTSAFTTASSSTEGHLLTINASGVPTFMHLQGGTF
jgi:trimeric autotransporter adhesin